MGRSYFMRTVLCVASLLLSWACASTPKSPENPQATPISDVTAVNVTSPSAKADTHRSESVTDDSTDARASVIANADTPIEPPKSAESVLPAPEVVEAFTKALGALASEDPEVALAKFQVLANDDPWTAAAHHNVGLLQERTGNAVAAEKAYRKALEFDPSQKASAQNLARLLLRQHRATEAITFFEKMLSKTTPSCALYDALALLFLETRRVNDSIAAAKSSLKLDEMDTVAMNLLAQAYLRQGRHELSLLILGNALSIAPGDSMLVNQQGVVLLSQGKKQEARTLFQKAADAQLDFPEAHSNLGALLLSAQNFQEAAKHLELALKYAPDFSEARVNLASAHRGMGDFEKAKLLYEQALQDDPVLAPDIEFNLGILYLDARDTGLLRLEQLEMAKAHLNTAQQLREDGVITIYLKDADKEIAREKRRLAREERNRLREEKNSEESPPADVDGAAGHTSATNDSALSSDAEPPKEERQ